MRRKLILILAVILVVGGASAPALLGWHTEQTYRELVEQLDGSHPDARIALEQYERGWLRSEARYTVEITGPWAEWLEENTDATAPIRIRGRDRVHHGPWVGDGFGLARVDSRLRMRETLEALDQREIAGRPIIHARSRINTRGELDSQFFFPDHEIDFEAESPDDGLQQMHLAWRDARGEAGVHGDTTKLLLRVAEIDVANDRGDRLALRDVEGGDRSRRGDDGLWLGEGWLSIGAASLELNEADQPAAFHLAELSLRNSNEADAEHISVDSRVRFDALEANGLALHDGALHVRASQLARAPFARLNRALDDAQRELADDSAAGTADAETEIRTALADLLRGSPELRTERLHVGTDDGAITGELEAAFAGDRPFEIDVPVSLIDPTSGHAELRAPRAVVRNALYAAMEQQLPEGSFREEMDERLREQLDQAIGLLVVSGLIGRDGDDLIVRIEKDIGGPPLVNDQDIMALLQALSELLQ